MAAHSLRAISFGVSLLISFAVLQSLAPMVAGSNSSTYKTGFNRWRADEGTLATWARNGVLRSDDGSLRVDPSTALSAADPYGPGKYKGHDFYNGGAFLVGEATSPTYTPAFAFTQAVSSWSADTPPGTWVAVLVRANIAGHWTAWYNLGVWAVDSSTVQRHSVDEQSDADGSVSTDTLVLRNPGTSLQMKVRLFSASRGASPVLHDVSVAVSTTPYKPATLLPGDSHLWNLQIPVPQCSQMVYKDGGEVWCSPTSLSMVLGYWKEGLSGACEPRVRAAVDGVYDWVYDGYGNWSFNAAYAASQGFDAYVARFTSLAQAEEWIAAGVPVIFSIGWGKGELTGAPIPASDGHLAVLVGFTSGGDPIVNDPAAPADASVQRVYSRSELESLWLSRSGGSVYLVYPKGWRVPGFSYGQRCLPAVTDGESRLLAPPACRE